MSPQLPSKTFCILPWIHFFHNPAGRIAPCCSAGGGNRFGNIKDFSSAQEIANTAAMKSVRREMLAGQEPESCRGCYNEERLGAYSFRTNKNTDMQYINVDQLLSDTHADGTLDNFRMQYWDARFSNICNLKCRMCGPEYSHTWAEELKTKPYVIHAHPNSTWQQIIARYGDLSQLREVYFAGGEALFQPEHWQMLEHLSELNKHNVAVTYTTNLTKLSHGRHRIEDYLNKFTNMLFIVSLDGVGKTIEYIRHGVKWNELTANLHTIKQFDHVKVKFNIVVTVYNILNLSDVIDFAVAHSTAFNPIDLFVAYNPEFSITNLPLELKQLAESRLRNNQHYEKYQDRIDAVVNSMNQNPVATWQLVVSETDKLDRLRQENIFDIVPEFQEHWHEKI